MRNSVFPAASFALALLAIGGAAVASPFEPRPVDDETYAEQWIGIVDLEDGSYAKVQLGISNAGPGDQKGACRVVFVDKDKSVWSESKVVDRDQWRYRAGDEPALEFGPCTLTAKEKLIFDAPIDGGRLRMEIEGDARKLKTPGLSERVGEDFYEVEILVPWAPATVSVHRKGSAPRTIRGSGYADHPRSTTMPRDLAHRWVRFRVLDKAAPHLFLARLDPKGRWSGWVRTQRSPAPVPLERVSLQPRKTKDRIDFRVMLDAAGGPWRITSKELLYRYAPIEEHGLMAKLASPIIGNPVTYTYRAALERKGSSERLEGILEVALLD